MLAGLPKFRHVDFLVPGVCGCSLTVSSVGVGAAEGGAGSAGAGMSSAGAGTSSAISSLLSKI